MSSWQVLYVMWALRMVIGGDSSFDCSNNSMSSVGKVLPGGRMHCLKATQCNRKCSQNKRQLTLNLLTVSGEQNSTITHKVSKGNDSTHPPPTITSPFPLLLGSVGVVGFTVPVYCCCCDSRFVSSNTGLFVPLCGVSIYTTRNSVSDITRNQKSTTRNSTNQQNNSHKLLLWCVLSVGYVVLSCLV